MVMCDQDQDVVRWGLHHLFGGHTYDTSGACGCSNHNGVPYCSSDYGRDYQYNNQYNSQYIHQQSSVENDEVLAHALQEELRQLAVAESSGTTESGLQASILAQDWLPSRDYHREMDDQREDYDDSGPSSCSSPERKAYDDEGIYGSLELTYESSALDGEVCKRLNQMVPVPHVPRINGEIPSVDEATSDHQRLSNRLQLYDLVELKVEGDGNCQFRALSDQFYRTPEHHKFVRQQVVNQLKSYPETYCGYVPMTYDEYIEKMSSAGQWGDHVTLQAAADSYGVKICVITSFKDTCFIEISPNVQKSKRVIFLSFWAEVHYNSIYPEGDAPLTETKKKKKWWHW